MLGSKTVPQRVPREENNMANQRELAKTYDPKEVENRTYQFWLDGHYFHAKVNPEKKPYTIVMPEHYGAASHGTCAGQYTAGYSDPVAADAGL